MINAFSVDLEDWFCVNNLSHIINKNDWEKQELRVEKNTEKLLTLFKKFNIKVTFFILGWIAEKVPELIESIDKEGHEIATHGYSHSLLTEITPDFFKQDLRKAIAITKSITNKDILGFRAPSFTITNKTLWAIDIMKDEGIKYDSSVFPISFHPDYGISNASLKIFEIKEGITEVPLSVVEIFGKRIPCSGGGYFRLYPYKFTKWLINKCNKQGRPVIFYLHPWEIDPGQPKINLPIIKRFRHYNNLNKTDGRLEKLLMDFEFAPVKEIIEWNTKT